MSSAIAAQPDALRVRLKDGVTIAVPSTLSTITTYVVLEQEAWFEKEIEFLRSFLKPGMTAIDIGANLGVYSLPMARLVGPSGLVFAYEPGSESRALLEQSRALNGLANLEIIASALSDGARNGHLAFASSSEFRALAPDATGEPVRITSLDLEDAARSWGRIDFIKIDAEGEEERIVAGARRCLAAHSPLIMFESKIGDDVNELRALFPAIGYRVFRQLAGAPVLIPDDARQPLDRYELNLFAAKPDRASALAREGLLLDAIPGWKPQEDDLKKAAAFWSQQGFAALTAAPAGNSATAHSAYSDALAGYAAWRRVGEQLPTRCAALAFALQRMREAYARGCTPGRASTFARIAWEFGARGESVEALKQSLQMLQTSTLRFSEPFWPASPRFDAIAPGNRPADWFTGAAAEQFERSFSFSSAFGGGSPVLPWLCQQPFASAEMERRRILIGARTGQRPTVPARLCTAAPDHLNAELWRAGMVPGTVSP